MSIKEAGKRGQQLVEDLNSTLNDEFEPRAEYREAIETALSFLESVIMGLDEDDKRDAEKEGG